MCEAMRWSHLPVVGGLYDQHPKLLEEWQEIWSEKASYQAEQDRKNKPKIKSRK
jgi:hypothetical protein